MPLKIYLVNITIKQGINFMLLNESMNELKKIEYQTYLIVIFL